MNAEAAQAQPEMMPSAPVFQRVLNDVEDYVRREPAKAAAAAFGAGLLLNFIPPRVIVGAVTAVAAPFMRPTLLALGLLKACELCKPERDQR
jgi:hypothetical protein